MCAIRNPDDRTSLLHPVKVMSERLHPSGVYFFAWGGGLPETVTTEGYDTEQEAFRAICRALRPLGRKPDLSYYPGVTWMGEIVDAECRPFRPR